MLAVPGELPRTSEDARWGYEFKWDGVRALAVLREGRLTLWARSGIEITPRYPELARLPAVLTGRDAICDGEVVAMDAAGRPDFGLLQNRMHRTGPEVAGLAAREPVTYLVFDLLSLDGDDLREERYERRRAELDRLAPTGGRWVTTPWFRGGGAQVHTASQEFGLEGVVAKRLDSPYRPGARAPEWRKIKHVRMQSVVVGGWRPGQGRRAGGIGSLLVGVPDDEGRLVFAGHVGTGFTDAALRNLERAVTARSSSPFADVLPREVTREARWVEPELVGEVAFVGWTGERRMRHPAWRGLRDDLAAADVREEP